MSNEPTDESGATWNSGLEMNRLLDRPVLLLVILSVLLLPFKSTLWRRSLLLVLRKAPLALRWATAAFRAPLRVRKGAPSLMDVN